MYTRNELRRKLAKTQRNLPSTVNAKERAFLERKSKKYRELLKVINNSNRNSSNRNSSNSKTSNNNDIKNTLEEAVINYYDGKLLDKPQITAVKHTLFETLFQTPFASDYNVIKTIGDGDCLIHAFLTAISPSYRRIPFQQRSKVGGAVRRDFIAPLITDPEDRAFFESNKYLEDKHIQLLGEIFHYNFIIFQEVPKKHRRADLPPNAMNNINFIDVKTGDPWVLLHNKLGISSGGDHYSAVQGPTENFIIADYNEGLATAKQLSGQEEAKTTCDFENDEIVVYKNQGYIIKYRQFEGDPPQCVSFTLINMDTGNVLNNIPIREIQKMAGGGRRRQRLQQSRTRKQRKNY